MNRAGLLMIEAESLDEVRGKNVYGLVAEEHREAFKTLTEDVFKGISGRLEFRMVGLKGRPLWLYTHAVPLRNEKGEITSLLATTIDITERKMMEEALQNSEEKYRSVIENIGIGIALISPDMKIISLNKQMKKWFPDIDVSMNHLCYQAFNDPPRDRVCSYCPTILTLKDGELHEAITETPAGTEIVNFRVKSSPIKDKEGTIIAAIELVEDITERQKTENALRLGEARLKYAQQIAHVGDWEWEIASGRVHWSDELYRIYGYTPHEIVPDYALVVEAMHPKSREEFLASIDAALKGDRPFEMDYIFFRKDGSEAALHTIGQVIRDSNGAPERMLGIVQDVTERSHAEEKMQTALWEKEILLKEIHHRVKNNLQIVASMLRLQSGQIRDWEARILFEESRNRVQAMSLIHERLYRTENLAYISFREYVDELVANICALAPENTSLIQKHIAVEEIILDINRAIPCGLIINELVSNSLRHAFPDGRTGAIEIGMYADKKGRVVLFVSDNGIGFPDGTDLVHTKTLGLQLVLSLVRQLNGTIELDKSEGTAINIAFNT